MKNDKLLALSICSGIEAASVAWAGLQIDIVAVSEIDKFPSQVLANRFPGIPNLGDFTKITYEQIQEITNGSGIDVLIGGTPCQSFSIAGLRKGLDSENGNLALEFIQLAARLRPRWVVWENVPGVFSSAGGKDFSCFLAGLTGKSISVPKSGKWQNSGIIQGISAAYSIAWRVCDAQHFGVPQRRRRVFVIGHIGADWRCASSVLFERHSFSGYPPPSKEERKGITGEIDEGIGGGDKGGMSYGIDEECNAKIEQFGPLLRGGQGGTRQTVVSFNIMPQNSGKDYKAKETDICLTLTTNGNHSGAQGGTYIESSTGDGYWREGKESGTLRAREQEGHEHLVCRATGQGGAEINENLCPTLNCNHEAPIIASPTVRRLTPIEAARLQGFPDHWTKIPWRNEPVEKCPDGHQYKCYGNSMAVPVIKWIGERIIKVEQILNETK